MAAAAFGPLFCYRRQIGARHDAHVISTLAPRDGYPKRPKWKAGTMSDDITVGDFVAEFLQAIGVSAAFGVVSVHNTPMLDAIGRRNAIRFIRSRGEAGAGSMADAYARVTGSLGVLFTSTGPGAANACGALVEARFSGSPVLHITGQTARANVDRGRGTVHDVPDQLGMLKSVSKAAYRVRAPEHTIGILSQAATEALTSPTGPVSVEIPIDIQRSLLPRPGGLADFKLPLPTPKQADEKELDELAKMTLKARRPMLWSGNGARHATEEVQRFADMGFGVITSLAGRGVIPEDHPLVLGCLKDTPRVEEFLRTADLLIIAGSRVRGHETREFDLHLPSPRIQIDIDPAANGRTYDTDLFLCADAKIGLAGLADKLEGNIQVEAGFPKEIETLKNDVIKEYKSYLGPYGTFSDRLRKVLPQDGIWVRDITLNNSTWGNRIFPLYGPRDGVFALGAAIGMGLAHGIGAAIGAPEKKVLCMCGDGGFFMGFAEFWTAAQEGVDVVLLIMNDGGYGVIKHIQDIFHEGRHYFADFENPSLEGCAKLADMPYWCVNSPSELDPAVTSALEIPGPALVEVDMSKIGEFPRYFVPPKADTKYAR